MPNRKLQELPDVSDFDASSILHTKEQSDNSDRKVQVQEILDLITIPDSVPTPDDGIAPASDLVVWSDVTDASGQLKASTFPAFRQALGIVANTGDLTNGWYNVGALQVRWGSEVSSQDTPQVFTFSEPFTTTCFGVITQREDADATRLFAVTNRTATNFTIDRNSATDGNRPFFYLAIGR